MKLSVRSARSHFSSAVSVPGIGGLGGVFCGSGICGLFLFSELAVLCGFFVLAGFVVVSCFWRVAGVAAIIEFSRFFTPVGFATGAEVVRFAGFSRLVVCVPAGLAAFLNFVCPSGMIFVFSSLFITLPQKYNS